jgi:3-phosphoshikimate 1-carboxyvinyltransferase
MRALEVRAGVPLNGSVEVPGDKSISHRALLVAAFADGSSVIRGVSAGEDVRRTEQAVRALGAGVSHVGGRGSPPRGDREHETEISGGRGRLARPQGPIDCGNSGTTMRLLAGLVASEDWTTQLTGDASLSARPMDRIAVPLRLMGAHVTGNGPDCLPPLRISGGSLRAIHYEPPQASAQVKSAVLFAGLSARGATSVSEEVPTRRHTEELLEIAGADISESHDARGHHVTIRPSELGPFELSVPGDPSQAAFWAVAACLVPGSEVALFDIYAGAARRGFIDVLARMGADLTEETASTRESSSLAASADLVVRHAQLRATDVAAAEITGLDEVPVLAVAASLAEGTTTFHDVAELRVKESDRLTGTAMLVRAFGGSAEIRGDDLVVQGVGHLVPAEFDAAGDHRMAMAAAVAAMAASGPAIRRTAIPGTMPSPVTQGTKNRSVIRGWESVATSYPGFERDLADLTGAGN